ncbi:MAG: hypothetical protein ABSH16_08980 [Sedimentisphaerales bacterium]
MTKEQVKPSLDHIQRLTDDTGLFQHAKFTIPLRSEGYATDDNARALIVATRYYALNHDEESLRLLDKYLEFILHSHHDDDAVRNLMNFDRTWMANEPAHDAFGRVIWAFGELLAQPPSEIYVPLAKERIDTAMPHIEKQYLRGMASSIMGLAGYLKRFPDANHVRECMRTIAEAIVQRYEENKQTDWPWFEDILTYDNAIIPCALFTAAITLNESKFLNVARQTCDFLLTNTFTADNTESPQVYPGGSNPQHKVGGLPVRGHFSFVGCLGWFPREGTKAQFDQQPIEAAGTILMLNAAYQATKNEKYLSLRQKAFNWFLGENDLGVPLYDFKTKGCSDGLGKEGVSLNQGAESTLSFLLGLLTMCEGCR